MVVEYTFELDAKYQCSRKNWNLLEVSSILNTEKGVCSRAKKGARRKWELRGEFVMKKPLSVGI